MTKCFTENKPKGAENFLGIFFYFSFFLSLSPIYIINMKFSSKISH